MRGTKFDEDKPDMSLVSPVLQIGLAKVLTMGKNKYGRYQYMNGFDYSRLLASLKRHLVAVEAGEDYDPESGEHHLFHVAANIQMIVDNMDNGNLVDDRPKRKGLMFKKKDEE